MKIIDVAKVFAVHSKNNWRYHRNANGPITMLNDDPLGLTIVFCTIMERRLLGNR